MTLDTVEPTNPNVEMPPALETTAPSVAPVQAQAPQDPPRPPLPQPLVNIWESFVLDQAARGRTEVQYMVPILISMLSERGVANMRPDDGKRRRLERWRDVLKAELVKIGSAKSQDAEALQDGFRAVDLARSVPLAPDGSDTGRNITHAAVMIFKRAELEEHKRNVSAHMAPTVSALRDLDRKQEQMVHHRLQLMQRLSAYSLELLEMGNEVVRKFQASELERTSPQAEAAEEDIDAALASLLPPPIQITYRTVFNTFWQKIERLLQPLMALEPPVVKAWRQQATARLVAALR